MKADRWNRIEQLFQQAAELPSTDRESFLDANAGDDPALRREVESLLAADEATDEFMEKPAVTGRLSDLLERSEAAPIEGNIGPYRLLRQLGEGGMSRVYLAVRDDDEFKKLVAIKVIREGLDGKDVMRRFRTERQILASLDHPHIARLLDGGSTDEGLLYFVMDFIEGEPIDAYCDDACLSVRERIELFIKVCSAVAHAHQNLVVHRDLKASNILVTRDGEPKLLDFGIAKLLKPEQFTLPLDLTSPNVRPLTPYYASPEQIEGGLITTATDVYSLGVLLFKLLTGHLPYRLQTQTIQEVERVVLEGKIETPSTALSRVEEVDVGEGRRKTRVTISPDQVSTSRATPFARLRRQVSGDLDNILLMALRREPKRRYPSVLQFSQDLQHFLAGEPVMAHKDSLTYRAAKFLRRNRVATAAAAAFLLLLISFSVTVSLQASRAARQRDQAQLQRDRAENVVRFLQGIFQVSDPMAGGGEEVTAREILDRGAARVERELAEQPEVQATLMEAIGNVYRNLGLFDSAEPLLRQALATRQQILGTEHPAVAQSLNNLAIVLRSKGDFAGAEPLFRRALEIRQEILPAQDPDIAQSLYNLARLLREAGRLDESIPLYRDAVSILRQSSDDRHVDLTAALIDLAILRTNVGDFDGAEPLFREALEIRRAAYPPNNPLVAEAVNDLGVFLGMRQRLEEAEPLFREALDIRRRSLGSDHPSVAETLNNLARLLREQGEIQKAESLFREGIANIRQVHGRDHPLVATLTSNLASLLQVQGNYAAAEVNHREALDIRLRILGENHQDVAVSLKNLGSVQMALDDPTAAEANLRRSIETFDQVLPTNHWRTAEARSLLGDCLAKLGRTQEAEAELVKGFEVLRFTFGVEHRRTQEALRRLVGYLRTTGDHAEVNRYEGLLGGP